MNLIFTCPHCNAAINAKKNIVLVASKHNEPGNKGLIFLHEEIGNYTVGISASLKIQTGDQVDFFCPVCKHSLDITESDNLAGFYRINELGEKSTVVISRTYGERCTFTIDDKKKVKSYGESVQKYLNPEWFL